MAVRETDHKNLNLAQLQRDIIKGKADGKILWQPRIACWYDDKIYTGEKLPDELEGLTLPEIYTKIGCSNRIYDYNACFVKENDSRVKVHEKKLSALETAYTIETPVGSVNSIVRANDSNGGTYPKKWFVENEEDMKILMWMEERCTWRWDKQKYQELLKTWGDIGAPAMFMPRVNVQHLYHDVMGVEAGIFAIYDYPEMVDKYFKVLAESHERMIAVINDSPIEFINFGDNLHCGTLPADLFKKYVLPVYQSRNELLHKAGKFTSSHWDGDTKGLLPFAKECGFDGIEAITPKPQGDITIEEIKEVLGDDIFLIDGIAAVLFNDTYPVEELVAQTKQIIDLFGSKLILGISDEMPSQGDIERIKIVGQIVDEYNFQNSKHLYNGSDNSER